MTATSGLRCYGRYGRYSPVGSLAKTLLASSRWFNPAVRLRWEAKPLCSERLTEKEYSSDKNTPSKPSAKVLNVKDTPSNRLLFRLVPSARHTAGTASGLLPTVQTQGLKRCNADGKTEFMPLELLPTPMSTEVRHGQRVKELKEAGGDTFHSRKNGETRPNGLMDYMDFHGMLPTQEATNGKHTTFPASQKYRHGLVGELMRNCLPSDGKDSPQLNPLFVEEMMGFPPDWLVSPFLSGEQNP